MADISIAIARKSYPPANAHPERSTIADFNLSIPSGEFVCLFGPSGCGKTTLLNIIAGLDRHFDGEISIGHQRAGAIIGYVFQNPRLLPWRTVRQNIELVLSEKESSPEMVDALLASMQLTQEQHSYPERLSLGMSRRVAIIRAFVINPDLLLMDEPFVSLDGATARQARELVLDLWQQRPHTVLFVTHDLREAITLADRIVFLSAAPMRIIHDLRLPLTRTARTQENNIEAFRSQLLQDYPEIQSLL
jgi:NitT/TauT family transport system ATP-binding protein